MKSARAARSHVADAELARYNEQENANAIANANGLRMVRVVRMVRMMYMWSVCMRSMWVVAVRFHFLDFL